MASANNRHGMHARRKRLRQEILEPRLLLTGPWTNPLDPLDVTGEGRVTARDALAIVNKLPLVRQVGSPQLDDLLPPPILGRRAGSDRASMFYDTTEDGRLTARDALVIVNGLRDPVSTVDHSEIPDQTDVIGQDAAILSFVEDFASAAGVLTESDVDVFRIQPTRQRVAVDLLSDDDERLADVRVIDQNRNEVARASQRPGREIAEGFEFTAIPNQDYFVVVEAAAGATVSDYDYSIEAYQYEANQWAPASDSRVGSDAHGDDSEHATSLALEDGFARASSHIDRVGDRDVFAVTPQQDRLSIESFGIEPSRFEVAIRVTDAQGRQRQPISRTGGAHVVATTPGEALFVTVTGSADGTGQYVLDVHEYRRAESSEDLDDASIESATPLEVSGDGLELLRTIGEPGDVDFFRFRSPEVGLHHVFLAVRGRDGLDVGFQVFDDDGQVVDTSSDSWASQHDWVELFNVDRDRDYFVRVSADDAATGEYTITVGFLNGPVEPLLGSRLDAALGDDIHTSSFDAATVVDVDDRWQVQSNIDFPDDEDLFEVRLQQEAAAISISGVANRLQVFDDQFHLVSPVNAIVRDGVIRAGTFVRGDSGSLFVRVAGGSLTGNYTLEISGVDAPAGTGRTEPAPDAELGHDLHGDDFENATQLASGVEARVRSNLDSAADVDVFELPVTTDLTSLEVLGRGVILEVFDSQEQRLTPLDRVAWNRQTEETVSGVFDTSGLGSVYVRVHSPNDLTGRYELISAAATAEDPVGDTLATASDWDIDEGTIELRQRLESSTDVDVYRIPNALPGSVLVIGVDQIQLELFDESGQRLAKNNVVSLSGGQSDTGFFEATPGTYLYLRVSSTVGATGSYSLGLLLNGAVPAELPDFDPFNPVAAAVPADSTLGDDVHGDEPEHATRLGYADVIRTSHVDRAGDLDVYRIRASGDVAISLQSDDLTEPRLRVLDDRGVELVPDIHSAAGTVGIGLLRESILEPGEESADLWIEVSAGETETGAYTLLHSNFSGSTELRNLRYTLGPEDDDDRLRQALVLEPFQLDSILGIDEHGERYEDATPIELTGVPVDVSSFIDEPDDRDAFRFTARYPEALVTLQGSGFPTSGRPTFELFDREGNPVAASAERVHDLYEARAAQLQVGREYMVMVSGAANSRLSFYQLQIQPLAGIHEIIGQERVTDLEFADNSVRKSGEIVEAGQVDLYRFSSSRPHLRADLRGSRDLRMQFIAAPSGEALTPISQRRLVAVLPGQFDNATHELYVAVWAADSAGRSLSGEYELSLSIDGGPEIEGEDTHAASFDEATELDFEKSTVVRAELNTADDVDTFRLTAQATRLTAVLQPDLGFHSLETIAYELFDAEGERVAPRVSALPEERPIAFEAIRVYDTVPGAEYFLSVANTSPNPNAGSLRIAWHGADGDLHGDLPTNATPLLLRPGLHGITSVSGAINPSDDVDLFALAPLDTASSGSAVSIHLRENSFLSQSASESTPLRLQIVNEAGETLFEGSGPTVVAVLEVDPEWKLFARVSSDASEEVHYLLAAILLDGDRL